MADETIKSKAVSVAVEVIKVTLALATGTLVFSAELLKEDVKIEFLAKCFLVSSWGFLGVSIIAGALAYMRIPVMIDEDKPNIKDEWFEWPGRIHHIAFLGGVITLGITMISILLNK